VTPADHLAEYYASLTQSEDRWEGELFVLERWHKRFWREVLKDWRLVVLIVPRKTGRRRCCGARTLRARLRQGQSVERPASTVRTSSPGASAGVAATSSFEARHCAGVLLTIQPRALTLR
jgi:hypothetical protein